MYINIEILNRIAIIEYRMDSSLIILLIDISL